MFSMNTLVIRIPDDLARELEAEAKEANLTKSEVARRHIMTGLSHGRETVSGFDLIADLVGTVEGGPVDMSTRKKDYLKTKGYGKVRHR
jgi:hypothetical protein